MYRRQQEVVERDKNGDEELFARESIEALESNLSSYQDDILVEIKVDETADLQVGIVAMGEHKLLDLKEVRDDEV